MKHKEPVFFQITWNACINCGACVAVYLHEAGFISAFDTIAVNTPHYQCSTPWSTSFYAILRPYPWHSIAYFFMGIERITSS